MSKDVAIRSSSTPTEFSQEQVDILRKTLFKGFNDDEIKFSMAVCNRTGLDPFVRQVHFTKRIDRSTNEGRIVITTGIDGFRLTASRSQGYAGSDEPVFELDKNGKPTKATVTVYKMVQGVRCPFTASVRWSEFYPGDGKEGFMWRKMPFGQLGKCAEAQALRKAFPAELSNIYSHEEMHQANSTATNVQTKAQEVMRVLDEPANASPDLEIEATTTQDSEQFPEEPNFDPADEDLGEFVIQFGQKYKGKKLKDLSRDVLKNYHEWVGANVTNKSADVLRFLEVATVYLGAGV
jgi:phage recombination protein Bet